MKRFLTLIFLTFTVAFCASAQTLSPKMFVGESLTYDSKLSRFITTDVADLTFGVTQEPNGGNIIIKTEARSKGTLLKMLKVSFLEQYTSTVDPTTFRIIKTTKHDVQKERVRDSVADFDYPGKQVIFVETDPKNPTKPPRRIASDLTSPMNDLISAIYSVRLLPLAVGKSFEVPVSDSGLVYNIPVKVAAREQQKTALGKVWCYRVEPEIFGKDRIVEQKGSMTIWIQDDARHLPVRASINTEYGKVEVRIRSYTKSNK